MRRVTVARSRSWRARRWLPMAARMSRCRSWTRLAALSGWEYMAVSCLCVRAGARLCRRDVTTTVALGRKLPYQQRRRRGVKKAARPARAGL